MPALSLDDRPGEVTGGRRLNRFGDRTLNRALHTVVNWRMIHGHQPTQHHLARRTQQKTDPEIRRRLERYTTRRLFRLMERGAALDKP